MFDMRFLSGRFMHVSGMQVPMSRYDLEESDDLTALVSVLVDLAWSGNLHRDHYHFIIDKRSNNRVVASIVDFHCCGGIDPRTDLPNRIPTTVDIELQLTDNTHSPIVNRYFRDNPGYVVRIR